MFSFLKKLIVTFFYTNDTINTNCDRQLYQSILQLLQSQQKSWKVVKKLFKMWLSDSGAPLFIKNSIQAQSRPIACNWLKALKVD